MGPGKIAYHLWYRPMAWVGDLYREGGPIGRWLTARGQSAMEAAAASLPAPQFSGPPATLYVMSGERFWHQTAFCLWSFAQASQRPLHPVVYSDGSLIEARAAEIYRMFPEARVISEKEITATLDEHLPESRFPFLRKRRLEYIPLRKVTDVHCHGSGWRLFVDSDILFFHRPDLLLDWLDRPEMPLRATDIAYAYGYPIEMLEELAGKPVEKLINTGLTGLRSEDIDWERMEWWCRTLIERAGTHYFQEQALVALQLAGQRNVAAPLADYVTLPRPPEARQCRAVLHHYVSESKKWYFRHNWRHVLSKSWT